jgi:hypothetical protein
MQKPALLLSLAVAGLPLAATPAAACSVARSYRPPSNLELTERADMILLGTAERAVPGARAHGIGEVIVRPVALLKGESLPAEVRLSGHLFDDPRVVVPISDPRDLLNPNRGALTGGCRRYIFRPGMLLLLFLQRDGEGRLHLASYPFARSAEDVPSPDALWVRAVRLYVEIAALPEAERRAALVARRDALRAATGDPDAPLLAADIDRQIAGRRIPPLD